MLVGSDYFPFEMVPFQVAFVDFRETGYYSDDFKSLLRFAKAAYTEETPGRLIKHPIFFPVCLTSSPDPKNPKPRAFLRLLDAWKM